MKWNQQNAQPVLKLYCQLGSYAKVGKKVGLSRERVRQILRKGEENSWFHFKKVPEPYRIKRKNLLDQVPKHKIIEILSCLGRRTHTTQALGIKNRDFDWLCSYYGIDWRSYYIAFRKNEIIHRIKTYRHSDGSIPSSYQLQRFPGGKSLYHQILSCFKSYDAFNQYLSEKPREEIYHLKPVSRKFLSEVG